MIKCPSCNGMGKVLISVHPENAIKKGWIDITKTTQSLKQVICLECGGIGCIKDPKKKTVFFGLNAHLGKINQLEQLQQQIDFDFFDLMQKIYNDLITSSPPIDISPYSLGVPPSSSKTQLDEEARFIRDWRSEMPRTWKGWSQSDINKQIAKVWLDEEKGVLCARFPYKQSAIDEFRLKIPKGKKHGTLRISFGSSQSRLLTLWWIF